MASETVNSEILANWLNRFSGLLNSQIEQLESAGLHDDNVVNDVAKEIRAIREVAEKLGARNFDIKLPTRLDDGRLGM